MKLFIDIYPPCKLMVGAAKMDHNGNKRAPLNKAKEQHGFFFLIWLCEYRTTI